MKNKHYVLTPRARQSLRSAKVWSKGRWGDEMTRQYFEDLDKAACYVAGNHETLVHRESLTNDTGFGIHPVREHYLVFVPIAKKKVAVVDVIRQGRDVPNILAKHAALIKRELRAIRESSSGRK